MDEGYDLLCINGLRCVIRRELDYEAVWLAIRPEPGEACPDLVPVEVDPFEETRHLLRFRFRPVQVGSGDVGEGTKKLLALHVEKGRKVGEGRRALGAGTTEKDNAS